MTDNGYFPRATSILRRVHEERAVGLLYGQRALGIGAISPLNFVGTRLHTTVPERPFRRLVHTAKMFEAVYFGSRAEADRVLATVHRMHAQVEGVLPRDAGRFPAGTPYSAFDPALMLWTVAVIADSAQVFYELLVRRLSGAEREALWQDYRRFGGLFGMPSDAAPADYRGFRRYWRERLASSDVHLTEEARRTGAAIMFDIPVPAIRRPAMKLHNLIMLGSLPPEVRSAYGLGWSAAHATAFRAAVAALRAPRPLTPGRLRSGRNGRFFDVVADSEGALAARGAPIPGALDEGRLA